MSDTTVLSTTRILQAVEFELRPDETSRAEIAGRLDLNALKKLSFSGTVSPEGARDLVLDATLGATVVQPCVVTGDPVSTRIDSPVLRRFVADLEVPEGDEIEMPEDDSLEPLAENIDLQAVMEEALALAVPDFPRAEGVEPVDITVTEPGVEPMSEEDAKPFAALKSLRDKLSNNDDNG